MLKYVGFCGLFKNLKSDFSLDMLFYINCVCSLGINFSGGLRMTSGNTLSYFFLHLKKLISSIVKLVVGKGIFPDNLGDGVL